MKLQKKKVKDNKKILYLGHDSSRYEHNGELTHFPIIETVVYPFDHHDDLKRSTHLILTSRQTVFYLLKLITKKELLNKKIITIGKATTEALGDIGAIYEAPTPTGEGVIIRLKTLDLKKSFIFYPHSALARPVIKNYLKEAKIRHCALPLYTTQANRKFNPIDLNPFDELVFTSPSTVSAFLEIYPEFPKGKKLTAIGPITEKAIAACFVE